MLETGPEFIAGSTRMKAGTAQKAALNCLSTGVTIRLSLVHRGKMVEMHPCNGKLRERAISIVAELANCDPASALMVLDQAGGSIKIATLMLRKSLPLAEAHRQLRLANGNLREALELVAE